MGAARELDLLREAVSAVACPDCQGSGRFDDVDCWHCRGAGAIGLDGDEPVRPGLVRTLWRESVRLPSADPESRD